MLVFIGGTVLAVGLLLWRVVPFTVAKVENNSLLEQKRQLYPVQEIYNEYQQVLADYNYLTVVYAQTENYNRGLFELIETLEKELPSVAALTSLDVSTENITINVNVPHKRAAAQLVMNLREIECFSDVSITALSKSQDQNEGSEEFYTTAITCTYGMNPYIEVTEETDTDSEVQEEAVTQ